MPTPAPTFPSQIPEFTGPNDAGLLRQYLNILIRLINALILYFSQIIIIGLKPLVDTAVDYTVELGDQVINVDAAGGNVTVTYDPNLSPFVGYVQMTRINKVDATTNQVLISNGSSVIDAIVTPSSTGGQVGGWRDVFGNGTTTFSAGVG